MSVVRTILGDIPASDLGVCYAHEHVIIDHGHATELDPQFLLADVGQAVTELTAFRDAGGRAMIDTMPGGAGRNVRKLAQVSQRSGVHIVAPTGLHLAKYYPPGHTLLALDAEALAASFAGEITVGVDDGAGPLPRRAGVIKVAGSRDRLTDHERETFRAAAGAHTRTGGCPIITHTEQGTAALEQVEVLRSSGAELSRVTLSHTDRVPDVAYHREVLSTGVNVEYDSAFRWKPDQPNHTLDLLVALIGEFPNQIMLGMDAARHTYWGSYGGSPGLAYLLNDFTAMMRSAGIGDDHLRRIFLDNPARAFSFARPPEDTHA